MTKIEKIFLEEQEKAVEAAKKEAKK